MEFNSRHRVVSLKLFDSIGNDPGHELHNLLPALNVNPNNYLTHNRLFTCPDVTLRGLKGLLSLLVAVNFLVFRFLDYKLYRKIILYYLFLYFVIHCTILPM